MPSCFILEKNHSGIFLNFRIHGRGPGMLKTGDVFTCKRSFSIEDVERFKDISSDRNKYHEIKDEKGRLIVHALLVATLPTKIGGEIGLLARTMNYSLQKPVYTGETIECRITITGVFPHEKGTKATADCVCINEKGVDVMKAYFDGIILHAW